MRQEDQKHEEPATRTIQAGGHEVTVEVSDSAFKVSVISAASETGVYLVHLRLTAPTELPPPSVSLSWTHPVIQIAGVWHPAADRNRALPVSWGRGFTSKATTSAPVFSLYGSDGQSRLTFAFSDALNSVVLRAGVHEETSTFHCSVALFGEPAAPISSYEATLRLDTRVIPYYLALDDVQRWWAAQPGYQPAPVPEVARLPMYSTWYSMHQTVSPAEIEEQSRLGKEIGCEAIIVDDGWQTSNNQRGYAYCGDWEPAPAKISDMREHVARVHALGMKYLIWYSVPFVGSFSRAFERFAGKFLRVLPDFFQTGGQVGLLDPRFPEVREYLIGTYERAVRDWDLDGFKLDFVDAFTPRETLGSPGRSAEPPLEYGGGRDYDSVAVAVDRLLKDTRARLDAVKPGIAIEFRQSYIGPLMRTYGTMFRAGDCPNDAVTNRVRTLDVRLLCGNTAAHDDPLMWHPSEPVESAALQLLNGLFGVPQVSVRLDQVPPEHLAMLRFLIAFWREHRDVLLDGSLRPASPELLFPVVYAATRRKLLAALYSNVVVRPGPALPSKLILVNATTTGELVLDLAEDLGDRRLEVRDCQGRLEREELVRLKAGLHRLAIPPSGIATLSV